MSKFARISGLKMLSYIHDPEGTVITGFSHILVLKKLNLNFLKALMLQILFLASMFNDIKKIFYLLQNAFEFLQDSLNPPEVVYKSSSKAAWKL
jgi:hypothetical protein